MICCTCCTRKVGDRGDESRREASNDCDREMSDCSLHRRTFCGSMSGFADAFEESAERRTSYHKLCI